MPDDTAAEGLTIDELARRTGMTVRNIRAHQTRGLLPAPEVRGRTGYYGDDHVARLELIQELQAEGFNLEAIRKLVDRVGGSDAQVLQLTRTAREGWDDETPEIVTRDELSLAFGADNGKALQRAVDLGLVRQLGPDSFEQVSPRVVRAGEELFALGIAPERSLEVLSRLRRHTDAVADLFIKLFLEEVWKPFDEAGRPPERMPAVREAIERLRPLAADAVVAVFGLGMADKVEHAIGRVLLDEHKPRQGGKGRRG